MRTKIRRKPEPQIPPEKRRWTPVVLLALIALGVGLLWLRGHPGKKEPIQAGAAKEHPPGAAKEHPWRTLRVPRSVPALEEPPPASSTAKGPELPVVDSVTVDKTEVCRGEENFVTVKAHSNDATDGFISAVLVDPGSRRPVRGMRLPFRLEKNDQLEMVVQGLHGSQVVSVPPVTVKDCSVPRRLTIATHQSSSAIGRVSFTAAITDRPGASAANAFTPVSYEWDFGDGTRQTTSTPEAAHSYENRRQDSAFSGFLVSATARDASGKEERGTLPLSFPNVGFSRLAFDKTVVLSIGVEPATTDHTEKIWVYHGYSGRVSIDSVRVRETVLGDKGEEVETFSRDYPVSETLGFVAVEPGKSQTVRDLTSLEPTGATAVRYVEMKGRTDDGTAAEGTFTLLPPGRDENNATVSMQVEAQDEALGSGTDAR